MYLNIFNNNSSSQSTQSPNKKVFQYQMCQYNYPVLHIKHIYNISYHICHLLSFSILTFSDIFQNATTTLLSNYLQGLLVGHLTSPQKFGKPFVGCWPLLVLLQMMLVPAVLEADWDLLQDHSQVVKKRWEEPVAVSLPKQLMSVADL